MAQRIAKIKKILNPQEDTRIFYMSVEEPLEFQGGNWIMLDPGIVLENGKTAKRAYSILSSDLNQREFTIAIKLLPQGIATNYIYSEAKVGSEFKISGPYGKEFCIKPDDSVKPLVVIATDTGITAALGIVLSNMTKEFLIKGCKLLWFREDDSYFLDTEFVKQQLPPSVSTNFRVHKIASTHTPDERIIQASNILRNSLSSLVYPSKLSDALFFLAGDGTVLNSFEKIFLEERVKKEQIRMDIFFESSNPKQR